MVKNKMTVYLLIYAVVAVWGIIIYRICFKDPDNEYELPISNHQAPHEAFDRYTAKQDTVKLLLNYRDPFLEQAKMPDTSVVVTKSKSQTPTPLKPVAPVLTWPAVKYSGYITNAKTRQLITILVVNDQERMLAEGESLAGVKLLKNNKDSILLRWQGQQKYIKP